MLDMGADWDEISKSNSQDIAVKDHGALLDTSKGPRRKEHEDAVFSMKPGDISDVVGSVFCFHIFRVTDRKVKTFGKCAISSAKLTADELNRNSTPKSKRSGVEIDESFFNKLKQLEVPTSRICSAAEWFSDRVEGGMDFKKA